MLTLLPACNGSSILLCVYYFSEADAYKNRGSKKQRQQKMCQQHKSTKYHAQQKYIQIKIVFSRIGRWLYICCIAEQAFGALLSWSVDVVMFCYIASIQEVYKRYNRRYIVVCISVENIEVKFNMYVINKVSLLLLRFITMYTSFVQMQLCKKALQMQLRK